MRHLATLTLTAIVLAARPGFAETGGTERATPVVRAWYLGTRDAASTTQRAFYTDDQLHLARAARATYAVGAAVGIAGIAPFLTAFLMGDPTSIAFASLAWTSEPVLMLVTDLLVDRALGRRQSAANIAGWVMLAITIALPTIGAAFYSNYDYEQIGMSLLIGGAVVFFPMQILTDVVGSRACGRARRMLRGEEALVQPGTGSRSGSGSWYGR
jgi:hypothetical protein